MKIKNTTTGQIENLVYAPTGCDCLHDLVESDPLIGYDDDQEIRTGDQATIDFWRAWIAESEQADELEAELAEKLGDKYAAAKISAEACDGVEFNDGPGARIKALTAALA